MNSRDAQRDEWMRERGFQVLRVAGSDIWMKPDKVLGAIVALVSRIAPLRIIRPSPVPLSYLAPNCFAALPLLLRRGHASPPLLSLQSTTRHRSSPQVLRWLETGVPALRSEKIVLLSGPMSTALMTAVQEAELIKKARQDPMLRLYLPSVLDANWLGYLQWRQESREDRARSLKRIDELTVPPPTITDRD